jgi:hypothetical protein
MPVPSIQSVVVPTSPSLMTPENVALVLSVPMISRAAPPPELVTVPAPDSEPIFWIVSARSSVAPAAMTCALFALNEKKSAVSVPAATLVVPE